MGTGLKNFPVNACFAVELALNQISLAVFVILFSLSTNEMPLRRTLSHLSPNLPTRAKPWSASRRVSKARAMIKQIPIFADLKSVPLMIRLSVTKRIQQLSLEFFFSRLRKKSGFVLSLTMKKSIWAPSNSFIYSRVQNIKTGLFCDSLSAKWISQSLYSSLSTKILPGSGIPSSLNEKCQ